MKVTIDVPLIVGDAYAGEHGGGTLLWVEFDVEPNVTPGHTYRTFAVYEGGMSSLSDTGCFRALWRDGKRVLVDCLAGWCPTRTHGILP